MNKFPITKVLSDFSEVFIKNGFNIYIVGGAVRDFLLGIDNHDYDFTTDATPQEVIKLFKKVIPTGIKHGTVTVIFKDEKNTNLFFEVTTFRTEGDYKDSRHPENVKFIRNLEEDLKRRDFTINALAASLQTGEIFDYHDGFKDLVNNTIRCINDAETRFSEDALRMLRACRFAAKLNFSIENKTFEAIKLLNNNILNVSKERIKDEIDRLLLSQNPIAGLDLMKSSFLLDKIIPELGGKYYLESLKSLNEASKNKANLIICYACLFSNLKRTVDTKDIETSKTSAMVAYNILTRLKSSNLERKAVCHLISIQHLNYKNEYNSPKVRRIINIIGFENINFFIVFKKAIDQDFNSINFLERIEKMDFPSIKIEDLKINGKDLNLLGIKPGPIYKKILESLLEKVIDNPSVNTKENLIQIIKYQLNNS
ncbi:MAG: CCA tRNA nucleotidyltransferase [Sphaerochaetaceae bacterium]|nr:CCA tRNA nucleotidyltransferase [Sphaerochaetaceae bacterium]